MELGQLSESGQALRECQVCGNYLSCNSSVSDAIGKGVVSSKECSDNLSLESAFPYGFTKLFIVLQLFCCLTEQVEKRLFFPPTIEAGISFRELEETK